MPTIDGQRVVTDLKRLAEFGRYKTGVHRPTYSPVDVESRHWLAEKLRETGLDPVIDGIGNVIGRNLSAKRRLLVGSHSETQPYGGWLDGSLGVIYGLELARAFAADPSCAGLGIEVAAWADEEGHYQSFLGSHSFTGMLSEAQINGVRGRDDGTPLREALQRAGLAGRPRERVDPQRYIGYLEAHIEQGDTLDASGLRIGVVETIVYIIKVTNESGMATTGVAINDALPPGLDFFNSDPGPSTISGNLISINVGTLQPGETRLVQVEAELGPTATAGSALTNRAYVVDSQGNSAQASFTGSVRVGTVTDNGRLSLSLTMPKTLTIAGGKDGTLKSSITITNGSRSDLQNVIVTLDGPPTATFDSATPGPTMSGPGSLTWVFPTFNGHANVAIKLSQKVSATVADGTNLSFHAAVRSDDGRTDSDSTTVTVRNRGS